MLSSEIAGGVRIGGVIVAFLRSVLRLDERDARIVSYRSHTVVRRIKMGRSALWFYLPLLSMIVVLFIALFFLGSGRPKLVSPFHGVSGLVLFILLFVALLLLCPTVWFGLTFRDF